MSSNFRTLRRSTATIPIGPSPDLYKKSSLPWRAIQFLRTQTGGVTPPACSRGAGGKCISVQRVLTIFLLIAAIKPRILERDYGWRRKHLQYRDRSGVQTCGVRLFSRVENADEYGLVSGVANGQTGGGVKLSANGAVSWSTFPQRESSCCACAGICVILSAIAIFRR